MKHILCCGIVRGKGGMDMPDDSLWDVAVPIEKLMWPKQRGTICGFWNQYEVMAQFQNPFDGLRALRIGTENCSTLSFYPEDILSLEIVSPTWFFSKDYPLEGSLVCRVTHGTKLKIHSRADCLDRFDDGQDAGVGDRMLPLFERIIHFPDIIVIDLVYDEDYWSKRSIKKPHSWVHLNKFISLCPPYDGEGCDPDNALQKGWLDEEGNLNIEWLAEPHFGDDDDFEE